MNEFLVKDLAGKNPAQPTVSDVPVGGVFQYRVNGKALTGMIISDNRSHGIVVKGVPEGKTSFLNVTASTLGFVDSDQPVTIRKAHLVLE